MTSPNESEAAVLARRLFDAWLAADRPAMEGLLAPDFTFTSPYDDAIDRRRFFERCWPAAGTFAGFDRFEITDGGTGTCQVTYEATTKSGKRLRNVEKVTTRNGQIRSVEVFFGRPPGGPDRDGEAEIRALIDDLQSAIHAGDVEAIAGCHDADTTTFDVVAPLRSSGRAVLLSRFATWIGAYDGPITSTVRDVAVEVEGDTGFANYLQHVAGTLGSGTPVSMWVRVTLGLKRLDGQWQIVHTHMSDPFDPQTGQALTGLEP